MTLSRRTVMKGGAAGALAAAAPGIRDARAASDAKIMHAVMQSDLLADGKKGWFGWPENTEYEALRKQWALVPTAAERLAIAQKMQKLAWSFVPLVPFGQWVSPAAIRPYRTAFPSVADRCASER